MESESSGKKTRDSEQLSILKPKRHRNPLSDVVDLVEAHNAEFSPTSSRRRSSRRVSFANSNFVKPFKTDEDKITVWESTYEETIDNSGSMVCSANKENVTLMANDDMVVENMTFLDATKGGTVLEYDDDMDLTGVIDSKRKSAISSSRRNRTIICNEDLEFTIATAVPPKTNRNSINFNENGGDDMLLDSMLNIMSSENGQAAQKVEDDDRMELSESIPLMVNDSVKRPKKKDIVIKADEFKTPPASFHTNITAFSSPFNDDDTQHLINYELNKPDRSDLSKIIAGEVNPSFTTNPNLLLLPLSEFSSDAFPFFNRSTTNLSKGTISLSDSTCAFRSETEPNGGSSIKETPVQRFRALYSDCRNNLKELSEIRKLSRANSSRVERLQVFMSNFDHFDDYVQEIHSQHVEEFSSSNDNDSFSLNSGQKVLPPVSFDLGYSSRDATALSFSNKLETKCEQCNIVLEEFAANENRLEFSALFKSLWVRVDLLDEETIVRQTKIVSRLTDRASPHAIFAHRVITDRFLSSDAIRGAVGAKYDIFTLLDYLDIQIRKTIDIMKQFDKWAVEYALKMDYNFSVTFKIVSLRLSRAWRFTVDLGDFEHPVIEDHISVETIIGHDDVVFTKTLAKDAANRFDFLATFIDTIRARVRQLSSSKKIM